MFKNHHHTTQSVIRSPHHFSLILGIGVLLLITVACTSDNKQTDKDTTKEIQEGNPTEVFTTTLETMDFQHELISNGKVTAKTVAELRFQATEVIAKIFYKNGSTVRKGDHIAQLDTYALQNKMEQAKDALERSRLEYQDVIIGQGYKLDQTEEIPADVIQLAKVKSGYNGALTRYELSQHDLNNATLIAPISGVIANLFAKPYAISSPTECFCNIIDTSSLEVDFKVLENELGLINIHDEVKVTPFAIPDLTVKGKVTEINPWVDENGMVSIKASISYHRRLIEGMNVKIHTLRSTEKQWVVPKSAVVLRTDKQVVFTAVNGKAIWNYVTVGLENSTQYTITSETLKEGDQIIVSGNISLAHETPIKVIESEVNIN